MASTSSPRTPLLVLGCGQRCGSTLVQRLLCSHPRVMIWGEHDGQLRPILEAVEHLAFWVEHQGAVGRKELTESGYQGFIANMTPPSRHVVDAGRAFVETLFAKPALQQGKSIWGFKEVRYGLTEIRQLHMLFPQLRVVVIVRDPRDVLCSLDDWERHPGWMRHHTEDALRNWLRAAGSFVDGAIVPELRELVFTVRYEELIAEPRRWTAAIAQHCALDMAGFDLAVFGVRVRNAFKQGPTAAPLRAWRELPADMRALLDNNEIVSVAASYGYHLS
jgi:hypothetical protein